MQELHVSLPEVDSFSNMYKDVESWKIRCEDILKGPLRLKVVIIINVL